MGLKDTIANDQYSGVPKHKCDVLLDRLGGNERAELLEVLMDRTYSGSSIARALKAQYDLVISGKSIQDWRRSHGA